VTLFESLVALVILGLTAAGFLGALHATSRSTRSAAEWVQAVGQAEAAMEQTKLGPADDPPAADPLPPGVAPAVELRPWPGLRGVQQVTVTVTLPGGGAFVLHRLARSP